jgi:hypothetical protein
MPTVHGGKLAKKRDTESRRSVFRKTIFPRASTP